MQCKLRKERIEKLFIAFGMGYTVISLDVPNLSCSLEQHFLLIWELLTYTVICFTHRMNFQDASHVLQLNWKIQWFCSDITT